MTLEGLRICQKVGPAEREMAGLPCLRVCQDSGPWGPTGGNWSTATGSQLN